MGRVDPVFWALEEHGVHGWRSPDDAGHLAGWPDLESACKRHGASRPVSNDLCVFASLRLCATNTSSRQGAEAQRKQGCWYSDGAGGPGLGPSPFHQVPTSCVRIKAVRCGPSGVAKGLVSFLHPSRSSKAQATTCRPFRALFIFWHRPWARAAWLHHAAPFGADAYSRVWKNILGHLPVGVISSSSRTLWLTALHSALKAMPDDT